jgi:DNA-binding NarL/FixJ family response regulator
VLTSAAERPTADGASTLGEAVLIAGQAPATALAQSLDAFGFATAAYERVDDLPDGGDAPVEPSIVVFCIEQPAPSLARIVSSLVQRFDGAPVILVCDEVERWAIRSALTSGAAGVVLTSELDHAFEACLTAVLAGQTCVPRSHQQQIEPPALSAREKQILGLVVMGYMNSQIAEQLFLAESTVKSHLSSAFAKLGVRSRNEAVKLILDPDNGFGLGILGLSGEPVEPAATTQP